MTNMLLDTGTKTFEDLVGSERIYNVPLFQRDYSWEEEEWEDLWLDIIGLEEKEEKIHYMGYVVLQSNGGKKFQIIDGQQRFTTLSIIAISVIKILEDWIVQNIQPVENDERKKLLSSKFLGHKDPASLILSSKLNLNRNNDDFYKSYLLRMRKPANLSRLKPSERRLWKAFDYFYDKIAGHFAHNKDGQAISIFLNETIANGLVFTMIEVTDDLNAYKVFETLNAREVRLSTTDLLKNFLFSIASGVGRNDLEEADRQWQNINDTLGTSEFPNFLRYYWNSRNKLERKQTLFKAIRKSITSSEGVFNLLNDLENLAPIYTALSNPADNLWDKEQRQYIDALTLFDVTQCYSLLMVAYGRIDDKEFTRLLRDCTVISFRYNIIGGLNANVMEDLYNKAAIKVFKGEVTTAKEIFNELKPIYVPDENFKNSFSTKVIDTGKKKKLIRYILFKLENQVAEKNYDYEDGTATIEHILPGNAPAEWDSSFKPEDQEMYIYRLGNYTLIEEKKNKNCGTRIYEEKKEIYKTSAYKLTCDKSIYTDWTPKTLRKRQEKLADIASTAWKINYSV
jgi:uncharacterized protein with ParB-like and HNH nuclease domain